MTESALATTGGAFPRPLTEHEFTLTQWMLEHGEPGAGTYLDQLSKARVVSRCVCGCASVNFEIAGVAAPIGPLRILGDYIFGDEASLAGAFVFEVQGVLAGLEVYGLAVPHPTELPRPESLRPFRKGQFDEP